MDINLKCQLQKILDKQKELDIGTRFRITNYPKADIFEMLLMCYKHEVEKRRIPFQDDKDTREKIEKAAKWLTGDYKVGLLLYGSIVRWAMRLLSIKGRVRHNRDASAGFS